LVYAFDPFFSPISWYPIGSYSLVPFPQLRYRLGGGEGREPYVLRNTTQPSRTTSWHTARLNRKPAAPMCWRKHRTTGDQSQRACAWPTTGVATVRWDKDIPVIPNSPLTRTTLGQLCAASLVSRSRPAATQPGIEPGCVLTPLALGCSALVTREAFSCFLSHIHNWEHYIFAQMSFLEVQLYNKLVACCSLFITTIKKGNLCWKGCHVPYAL
jgi:hypothetical protein